MKPRDNFYNGSYQFTNWGRSFDSLAELKFAVSIMEDYEFLRERLTIYYHPGTLQHSNFPKNSHRHYTPDFLIRHKQTCKAFLIEIKPKGYPDYEQLDLRRAVAEQYIISKRYDWIYKVMYDDEIILSAEQLEEFEHCCKLPSKAARKEWFTEYARKLEKTAPSLFAAAPSSARTTFVIFGNNPPTARRK